MPLYAPKPGEGKAFTPCPAGWTAAVCVDVVDLGDITTTYADKTRTVHKVRLVWQTARKMEDGRPFLVMNQYSLSFNEWKGKKSGLLELIESWGVSLDDLTDENGPDVERLIGKACYMNIVHKKGEKATFANIGSLGPLPEGMLAPKAEGYVRVVDREKPKEWTETDAEFPYDDSEDPGSEVRGA